jgi:hypothetical protein
VRNRGNSTASVQVSFVDEMYWSESLTGKQVFPPPQQQIACMVSQQRYMHFVPRTSYVRGRSIFVFAVRRMQYMHVCVVCACVGCVLRPYQIAAFDNSVENNIGSNKNSCSGSRHLRSGGSILNQEGKSHINIRK